jgi:hypothetical protein
MLVPVTPKKRGSAETIVVVVISAAMMIELLTQMRFVQMVSWQDVGLPEVD